jgi:phospholipid/cholesterol/gamma-HCH transport system ATP-binding protein
MIALQQAAALKIASLYYRVQGRAILQGIDLEVNPGEILAVMGRSGCGKTTLLKLIMGLLKPSEGKIWVGGREISHLDEGALLLLRRQMGYIFQNAALFDSLTVGENVGFGLKENNLAEEADINRRVKEKLALVGMENTEELYPAELSGGMRKRVGIARALAMEPSIILYDEPTVGQDPPTAGSLNDLMLSLRDRLGVTSIVVSHDLAYLAQVADRAAMMAGGKIISTGSLAELARSQQPELKEFFLFWKGEKA